MTFEVGSEARSEVRSIREATGSEPGTLFTLQTGSLVYRFRHTPAVEVSMPWQEKTKLDQRTTFVRAFMSGEQTMAAACRQYEISRPTGYKWLARYRELGLEGLLDVRSAPKSTPHKTDEAVVAVVVRVRKKYPSWGPKKIRGFLRLKRPSETWPAASTIGDILKRAGLVKPRQRHRFAVPRTAPLKHAKAPNDLWTMDFKGQFRLGDGEYCYPLTVVDAYSRKLLGCIALPSVHGKPSKVEVERLFEAYGMPKMIRTDNGSPFASQGLGGLSRLSAHWLSLGVGVERIEPGHPEQNGSHERMHLTLKCETARPAASDMRAQQERFDDFLVYFNEIRPHEALEQTTPDSHYTNASKRLNDAQPDYRQADIVCRVAKNGSIRIRSHFPRVHLGTAFVDLELALTEADDGLWLVTLGSTAIAMCEDGDSVATPIPPDSLTEYAPEEVRKTA